MITSLDDAWRWYESTRTLTKGMQRLGVRYWSSMRSDLLAHDDYFKDVESIAVVNDAEFALENLNDLCVLLLFSVFESRVRDQHLRAAAFRFDCVLFWNLDAGFFAGGFTKSRGGVGRVGCCTSKTVRRGI